MVFIRNDLPPPEKPTPRIGRFGGLPFKEMEVGECAVFDHITDRADKKTIMIIAHNYGRQVKKRFTSRTIDGVLHVWRIK